MLCLTLFGKLSKTIRKLDMIYGNAWFAGLLFWVGMGYVFINISTDSIIVAWKQGRKEMFYLTTHSTHFIYGYTFIASDIW